MHPQLQMCFILSGPGDNTPPPPPPPPPTTTSQSHLYSHMSILHTTHTHTHTHTHTLSQSLSLSLTHTHTHHSQYEAIPESLKNMLLVMSTQGIFDITMNTSQSDSSIALSKVSYTKSQDLKCQPCSQVTQPGNVLGCECKQFGIHCNLNPHLTCIALLVFEVVKFLCDYHNYARAELLSADRVIQWGKA